MNVTIGARVRDAYTNKVGRVTAVHEDTNRLTVDFGEFKVTGCQSWFLPVEIDK